MSLDVVHSPVELFVPLVQVVVDAMGVRAGARHALHRPGGLFDLLVVESSQRQLRRVEGDSVGAMDR